MGKKRILIFSLAYYPRFVGGAEAAIKEITGRLDPALFEFDLITLRLDTNLPRVERIGAVTVHRIGFSKKDISLAELSRFPWYIAKVWYPIGAFFKAASLDRTRHYDALWSMMTYMGFPAVLFKLFFRRRIPYILTLQDGDSIAHIVGRLRIRLVAPLLRLVFTKAAVIQVISAYLGEFARSRGYQGRIEVIPNGVNIPAFTKEFSAAEREAVRAMLGVASGETLLVTTSRLVAKNALDDVINALEKLPASVKFLILGIGPDEAKLKTLAVSLGVEGQLIFHGFVDNADIPRFLAAGDIFIRPSLSEGMGSSFVEAMAAHLPVLATPVGGIVDFLFDPDRTPGKKPTGLFVNVHDPESIVRQVSRLIADPALAREIADNARLLAIEKYDWNLIVRDMQEKVFGILN